MKIKKLSELLQKQRMALEKTQKQVAEEIGVFPGQYSRWEREGKLPRNSEHRLKLAIALDIPTIINATAANGKMPREKNAGAVLKLPPRVQPAKIPSGIPDENSEEEDLIPLLPIIMESGTVRLSHDELMMLAGMQPYFRSHFSVNLTPGIVKEVLLALRNR